MHPLISTAELAERLAAGAPRLRLFDATTHLRPAQPGPFRVENARPDYEAAHIPGAAYLDLQQQLSDARSPLRFMRLEPEALAAAFAAAGLGEGDEAVLYSSTSPMWATRVWWLLRGIGVAARVLDGGLPKWRAEGRPLATGDERHPPARLQARPRGPLWADRDEVLRAVGDDAVCTLNALTATVHAGTAEFDYGRKGHIAGSVNVPYPALLAADGTLLPLPELRRAFDAVGALQRPRVICYCGGGIAATLTALALHLLGHENVAVYDASLSEWVLDPALPMETGA